ncbi:MAG TPA: hypothetical protein PKK53_07750, partial [Hydrogenophilus thermoluteolus]|nr:hypothetical protein [Hydrogenophilus thermoluteolus]
MVKALLFDVDGTLAETEALHRRAFNEAIVTTTSPENIAALLAALWPDDAPPFATWITAREAP